MSLGCHIGRRLQYVVGEPLADAAAFQSVAVNDPRVTNGCLTVKLDDNTGWIFDTGSSAVAGPTVIVPSSATGRFLALSGAGGVGVGMVHLSGVRARTTAALPANTRVGNVLTANANGALAAQDSITLTVNQRLLVANEGTAADNGPHAVTQVGTAGTPYILTRVAEADTSAEVTAGLLHYISEGTTFGNEWAYCTTDDAITLNTTALDYVMLPNLVDLASVANGLGAALIGVEDPDATIVGTTGETALVELSKRQLAAAADDAALIAITAAQRVDGALCVKADDVTLWGFDAGSAAAASDWVQVPTGGTGRWHRKDAPPGVLLPSVADNAALIALAAINRQDGSIVVQLDTRQVWEYQIGSVAAASDWVVVPTDGVGRWYDVANPNGGLVLPPVADNAALIALTAVDRQDGSLVVQLDTRQVWKYQIGSVAAASDWLVVPTDGVGRWYDTANPDGGLVLPPVADNAALIALTAVDRQDGSLLVQLDTMQTWKYDLGSAAGASDWVIAPTDGVGRWLDVGYPNGGLVLPPVADDAALIALTAVDRQDGSIVIKLDDLELWKYDLGSAAGASDWIQVPTDTVGRWLRTDASLVDLAGVTATTGGELVGQYDPNAIIAAVTLGAATREIAGEMNTHRPGVPMINRLIMLGAPGAIVGGDTVTIGGDIYEFNTNTPPDVAGGGTGGSIWVYQGANSAASRANFINAVNNVTDAPNITYDGAVTESMIAVAGTLLGTVDVRSADAIGPAQAIAPSGVATATTEVLTTVTDLWDQATMYAGQAQAATQLQMSGPVVLTAEMILQGWLEVEFDFTPVACLCINRMRPQTEAYTITADRVVLTLGGAGAPANQPADVIDIIVLG